MHFSEHGEGWILDDGSLNKELFYTDYLHLAKPGNEKFASENYELICRITQETKTKQVKKIKKTQNSKRDMHITPTRELNRTPQTTSFNSYSTNKPYLEVLKLPKSHNHKHANPQRQPYLQLHCQNNHHP